METSSGTKELALTVLSGDAGGDYELIFLVLKINSNSST
jgi:hypothetical protein